MPPIQIHAAHTADLLAAARVLFAEYAASLPESAQRSLRHQGFDAELATLPGKYAHPGGIILLAADTQVTTPPPSTWLGVVAMRPLALSGVLPGDPSPICEMKRLYVRPAARGLGAGRALCEALLTAAAAARYRMMKLDTEADFAPAMALYRALGFTEIPRYNDDPEACTVWMGKHLNAAAHSHRPPEPPQGHQGV
ncbi:MAG: GNAT family N-acetyltransferase [Phycisphaerales bacterium]